MGNKSGNKSGIVLGIVLATIILVAAIGGASADTEISSLPYNADVPGEYYYLTQDLSSADTSTAGINAAADGVIIDGRGYSITGSKGTPGACDGAYESDPAVHSGVRIRDGSYDNVVIKDLEIKDFCTGIALGRQTSANNIDNVTVTGCEIHDNGVSTSTTHGLHMYWTNDCDITGNSFYNNDGSGGGCSGGGDGIFMYGQQSDGRGWYNSFTCNNFSYNTKSGFFMKHQCMHNYFGNNYAVWNGEGGIVPMCMMSNYNTYDRNNLSYNYKWGFMTRGYDNEILNNTMIGNGRDESSPGISISAHSGNVVNDNTVCGSGGMDIAVNGFATCADNTCDTTDCAGGCPWNCDNSVSVYYDFDEDTSYSGLFGPCCNLLSVGAGNNPGLFNESGASTHCDSGFCIYPDPGDDANDCGGAVEPKPDLTITDKYETWISEEENTYNITYTVCNIGDAPAGESRTRIKIDGVPNPPPGVVPALDVDECFTQTLEGPYTCSCGEDGVDTIELCADGPGWIDESNENNNCLENVWECYDCYLPDLTITDKSEAWVNETHYNITYAVCNIGNAAAPESRTRVKIDGVPTGMPGIVPALDVDECYTETLPYTIEMSDDNDTIELCADGPGMILESNETNNCLENVFVRQVELADLIIEDIRPIRWCCCCIESIRALKGGDDSEKMQVMFIDDPELAKELGDDELRKEVAKALAKDPKLAEEVAAKLAGDDKAAAKELSRDPKQLAERCCYRSNVVRELADLLDTELTAQAQHEMSDQLDMIVGGGCCGGCCCNCLTTDCRCCCCGRFVAYKIRNNGTEDAGFSLSNLTVNGRVRSVDIVRPLDAGQSRWEVFPCYRMWWWPHWPREVTVCADITDWVTESNETNNCRAEWWPGLTPGLTPIATRHP